MSQEIAKRIKIMSPNIITDKKPKDEIKPSPTLLPVQPEPKKLSEIISFETADVLLASMGLLLKDYTLVPIIINVTVFYSHRCRFNVTTPTFKSKAYDVVDVTILVEKKDDFDGDFFEKLEMQHSLIKQAIDVAFNRKALEMICSLQIKNHTSSLDNGFIRTQSSYITATGLRRRE